MLFVLWPRLRTQSCADLVFLGPDQYSYFA
jgi:hypothetical protein